MSEDSNDRSKYDDLPPTPSSVYTRDRPDKTLLQRFRGFSEETLMEAAKQEMREDHPEACGPRARTKEKGPLQRLFRALFVTGFRLTPSGLRRQMARMMFRDSSQDWPPSQPLGPGRN